MCNFIILLKTINLLFKLSQIPPAAFHIEVIPVVHVMLNAFSAAVNSSSLGRSVGCVVFQLKLSVPLVHGGVAMIHSRNPILLLKHCRGIMGTGILNMAKLKLSITLIKSTALSTTTHR